MKSLFLSCIVTILFCSFVFTEHASAAAPLVHEVYTFDDLQAVGSGESGWNPSDTYILMNDIDLSGRFYDTAVIMNPFYGVFDGNGHVIRNFTIEVSGEGMPGPKDMGEENDSGNGLFSINYGSIAHLGVEDFIIYVGDGQYIGGICGLNFGLISSCYANGTISGSQRSESGTIGILCGKSLGPDHADGQSVIEDCYSSGSIILYNAYSVGGFIGHSGAIVRRCYSTTQVDVENEEGEIMSMGMRPDSGSGAFIGREGGNSLTENCYCFAGYESPGSAVPLSFSQMLNPASYTGFDFVGNPGDGPDDIWAISPGHSPKLAWQSDAGPTPPSAPYIVSNPESTTIQLNQTTVLNVVAAGAPAISYQWYEGESGDTSSPIPDATNTVFTTPPATANATYWVLVSNPYNSADSSSANVLLAHEIYTTGDLLKVGSNEAGWGLDDGYLLMNDIDLSGIIFSNSVFSGAFAGVFDGNGHLIHNLFIDGAEASGPLVENLDIGGETQEGLGLFGQNQGIIEDLGLYSYFITNATQLTGALCGANFGTIRRCYVYGQLINNYGNEYIGGLCGQTFGPNHADGQSSVSDCYSFGNVISLNGGYNIGGLIGHSGGQVSRCYSATQISVDGSGGNIGALIGNEGGYALTQDCYCYYLAGPPGPATPLLTSEMDLPGSYVGFDFTGTPLDGSDDTWDIAPGHCPSLSWESGSGMPVPSYSLTTTLAGNGSPATPFLIANLADFNEFCSNPALTIGHYLLLTNLDLSASNYTASVVDRGFSGQFHGGGHIIENMSIDGENADSGLGLFAENRGVIEDLGVDSFSISNAQESTGAVCGENYGTIWRCYTYGDIYENNGNSDIGGLCGKTYGPDHADGQSVIEDCYSFGTVNCSSSSYRVGGLIGHSGGIVRKCYSATRVIFGDDIDEVGGFIGNEGGNSITESCYQYLWAGPAGSATTLTMNEMHLQGSYIGFDFAGTPVDGTDGTWDITAGSCPRLSWESGHGMPPPSYMPVTTLAGDGTSGAPFIIASHADFVEFSSNDDLNMGYYLMLTNINLSGISYSNAVVDRLFLGHFDGNMHVVGNMFIDGNNGDEVTGLFSENYGVIQNLGVVDFVISNANTRTGALCGENYGTIRRCFADGLIENSSGNGYIGGLCGQSYGPEHANGQSIIEDCYSSGRVIVGYSYSVGGLVGHSGGQVRRCYSTTIVTGAEEGTDWKLNNNIGGLIGHEGGKSLTEHCYCYAGEEPSGSAQSLSYTEMLLPGSYVGFDFVGGLLLSTGDTWDILPGHTPILNGQLGNGPVPPSHPIITSEPQNALILKNQSATLEVTAEGSPSLFYQWFEGESGDSSLPIAGATSDTYITLPITNTVVYWVMVSNAYGVASSRTAEISCAHGIYTLGDLLKIGSGVDGWNTNSDYILMNGLDLSGTNFPSAVIENEFYGTFEGNGHVISNMLISAEDGGEPMALFIGDSSDLGLFHSNYGIIQNLGLENFCISNALYRAGGLCAENYGRINRCFANGCIIGDMYNNAEKIGGLCGQSYGPNHEFGPGIIEDCYSSGSVEVGEYSSSIGGLIGHCGGYIRRCYTATRIICPGINRSLGALIGKEGGNIDLMRGYSYQWAGPAGSSTPLSTAQMQNQSSFNGFDFSDSPDDGTDDIWSCTPGHCPKLSWESGNGILPPAYSPMTTLAGSGTPGNPFIISNLAEFEEFYTNQELYIGHYLLTTDIDLSGSIFDIAVINRNFYGDFDGNGHVIDNMFIFNYDGPSTLILPEGAHYGLFAINSGSIDRVGVDNYLILETGEFTGGLCGENFGRISRSFVSGTIMGSGENGAIGGLCGKMYGPDHTIGQSMIEDCHSSGRIVIDFGYTVGGFIGHSGGVTRRCYSTTKVSIDEFPEIEEEPGTGIGGFIGSEGGNSITEECYVYLWAGNPGSALPLNTDQMQMQSSYQGFDFTGTPLDGNDDTWAISPGYCPRLSWQSGFGPIAPEYTADTTLAGNGSFEDPFIIASLPDFVEFYSNPELSVGYYRLITDIDLAGYTYYRAVVSRDFYGHFNGEGHVVANMFITDPDTNSRLGLFDTIQGSVCNLGVVDCFIQNALDNSVDGAGAICGSCAGGSINDCFATGEIYSGNNSYGTGGICGYLSNGNLTRCYYVGDVVGNYYVGGLCGQSDNSEIRYCFTDGYTEGFNDVGGICGMAHYTTIRECYSRGTATGDDGAGICGYLYYGSIIDCYAAGPVDYGICGYSSSSDIFNCFWDSDTCGTWNSYGGTPKTTAEMQDVMTFVNAGWDFYNTWYMNGYPELINCYGQQDSFARWITVQGAPVDQRGESDTPAGDTIENLLKYACGLPAMDVFTTQDLMVISVDPVTGGFAIEYMLSKSAVGVLLEPLWTPILPGTWTTADITYKLLDENAEFQLWRATIPVGPSGFMRLRATQTGEPPEK